MSPRPELHSGILFRQAKRRVEFNRPGSSGLRRGLVNGSAFCELYTLIPCFELMDTLAFPCKGYRHFFFYHYTLTLGSEKKVGGRAGSVSLLFPAAESWVEPGHCWLCARERSAPSLLHNAICTHSRVTEIHIAVHFISF